MRTIYKIVTGLFLLSAFIACDDYGMFEKELYKKQIYFVSNDNLIFPVEYSLDEENNLDHFSIAYGGTTVIDEPVNVSFVIDTTVLDRYNYSMYDIDSSKYAKNLHSSKYKIPNMTVTIKNENPNKPYVAVPLLIEPSALEGLSPDSSYFIPMKITDVSRYEINPKKQTVLCQVFFKNRFASVKDETVYYALGYTKSEGRTDSTSLGMNKEVFPISKNTVRVFAGVNAYNKESKTLLNDIKMSGLNIEVKTDGSLHLYSFDPLRFEVEQLNDSPIYKNIYDSSTKSFYLHYKYRNRTSNNGVWSKWITVSEINTKNSNLIGY